MTYRVKIEPSALDDLRGIVERFEGHADVAGPDWYDRLIEHIFTLRTFPTRCPIAERESERVGVEFRCLLFGRKPNVRRILFEIDGSTVYVHHVVHGAREH